MFGIDLRLVKREDICSPSNLTRNSSLFAVGTDPNVS